MNLELNKQDLITLVGTVSPSINECLKLVVKKQMRQVGNQHNYGWSWEVSFLNKLSERELFRLYNKYK